MARISCAHGTLRTLYLLVVGTWALFIGVCTAINMHDGKMPDGCPARHSARQIERIQISWPLGIRRRVCYILRQLAVKTDAKEVPLVIVWFMGFRNGSGPDLHCDCLAWWVVHLSRMWMMGCQTRERGGAFKSKRGTSRCVERATVTTFTHFESITSRQLRRVHWNNSRSRLGTIIVQVNINLKFKLQFRPYLQPNIYKRSHWENRNFKQRVSVTTQHVFIFSETAKFLSEETKSRVF